MQNSRNDGRQKTNWIIPICIIIAGAIVAGALIYIKRAEITANSLVASAVNSEHPENNMPPVTAADHILGNPNAPVMIVEYSDTDCPYCQQYHKTLQQIMAKYGDSGQVAWVYRHFAFHPKAPVEAEATECAAELGGNQKFWQYLDTLFGKKDFSVTPYVGLDPAQLPTLAVSVGLDRQAFSTCLASDKYRTKVTQEYNDAIKAGGQGTPYTILVTANGKIPISSGAVSYSILNSAIATLLNQTPQ